MIVLITTVDSRSMAEKIAEEILKSRLAACVSIFPVASMYRRKGKIEKSDESMLFIKTTEEKRAKLVELIKEIHPYDLPEILIIRAEASKEYEQRLREETGAGAGIRTRAGRRPTGSQIPRLSWLGHPGFFLIRLLLYEGYSYSIPPPLISELYASCS